MSVDKLAALLDELSSKKHYFLNLYPHGSPSVILLDFDGEDVIRKVKEVQRNYGAHIWYIE